MKRIRIAPGAWHGERRPVCDTCGWPGASTGVRQRAVDEGEAHECDPDDLERMQALAESVRVVAVPTEGA